jgi:ribosomal protein S18 acetylase RimI-like enzyme
MAESSDKVAIKPGAPTDQELLVDLYSAVDWTHYAEDPRRLMAAIEGADFVVSAMVGDSLVGLARCVSDDVSIVYIQDILVRPEHQGKGVGKSLVRAILERYCHVRQKVLLTDTRPEQLHFYGSLGFKNTRELKEMPLNAFVMRDGMTLK